ncbi:hypothetical protein AMELA_G00020950 [Ameiurus melas]|uniref:Reverse transcriptase domain-containing protein n=1 Tax=Ameiurus melas TaxID=219545 RepID=A0A7J6BBJ1_AMEME|nr:hypothetical protein AMELA_G00020950 [Ameiurus melas]
METAMLSVSEALRLARATSRSSVLILLVLSAAFDTVKHQIFLSTLSSLGITGMVLHLVESYLSDRSFKVSWRGGISETQQLTTGVPQGSVLGPLLFSIYTTSLGQVIESHGLSYHCYDTHLHLSYHPDDPPVSARISACLSDISVWMKEHHLKLAKSELLIIPACPSINHNLTVQLSSLTLMPTRMVRNLGVILDDDLIFTVHISATAVSCSFILYNIKKIRPNITEQATQLLVQALVISKLDYCNSLLYGLPARSIKPLQMIQIAAAFLVFSQRKRMSYSSSPSTGFL